MVLPIDRTAKAALDANLVNGTISDAPAIKASDDVVYNTIDELYNYTLALIASGALSPYPPAQYNKIINGNIDIWQRGTSFTLASGSSIYSADRFKSLNNFSGTNSTVSRVPISDLDGSRYGLQIVHAGTPTAIGRLSQYYTIEAADSYKLAGKQVTFSCKVKGILALNKFQIAARYNTTESAITASSAVINSSTAIINNSSWTTINFTFICPSVSVLTTSGVIGFEMTGYRDVSEANGDGWVLAQLQVNAGEVALPFQPRSYDEEKRLCKRYYQVLNSIDANTTFMLYGNGMCYSTTNASILIRFEEMRTRPTVTFAAVSQFALYNAALNPLSVTVISQGAKTISNIELLITVASGLVAGNSAQFISNNNNTSSIGFDAEL